MKKLVDEISSEIGLDVLEIEVGWDFKGAIVHHVNLAEEYKNDLLKKYKLNELKEEYSLENDFDKSEELLEKIEELEELIYEAVYEYALESLKCEYKDAIKALKVLHENYI